jgi:hypothetical protein
MRLDPVLVAEVDKVVSKRGTTRTGLIRQWIEEGLKELCANFGDGLRDQAAAAWA